MNFFGEYFEEIYKYIKDVDPVLLENAVEFMKAADRNRGKVIIVGNGGSAAIASHVSVDLTKNARIRALNFNEAALLTCFSNDYGYENWVEESLKCYADQHDVVVLISSSGKSKNILNGALTAKQKGLKLITFSGFDENNPLKEMGDINFYVNSRGYNIVETVHQVWLLSIIDRIIGSIVY